ncbi:MAG: hypothetical protein WBM76_05605 [Woeseiaceae bacterium]
MKTRKVENGLAYVGALVVLMGVLAAASSAFAAEPAVTDSATATQRDAAAEAVIGAKEAMRESADVAAKAIKVETSFDLENQLSDIRSTLIAANR